MGEEGYDETRLITDRGTIIVRGGYGRDEMWLGISPGRNDDDHPDLVVEMSPSMQQRLIDAIKMMQPDDIEKEQG